MRFGEGLILEPTMDQKGGKDGNEPYEAVEPTGNGMVVTRARQTLTSCQSTTYLVAGNRSSDVRASRQYQGMNFHHIGQPVVREKM